MSKISMFHDVRWIDFCETIWRILDLFINEVKSSIQRFRVYLSNQQRVMINLIDRKIKKQLQKNKKLRRISLIEYFKINRLAKKAKKRKNVCLYNHKDINKNSRDYFYQNISKHFTWNKIKKTWTIRKKNRFVKKKYFMNLKIDEIFYLCLLLINRKSVTFFDDLRIMNV